MKKTLSTLIILLPLVTHAISDVIPVTDVANPAATCPATVQNASEQQLEKQQFNNGFSTKKYPRKFNNKFRNENNKFSGPTLTEKAEKWHARNEEHFSDIKQQLAGTKAEHKEALDLIKKEVARVEQELKQELAHVKDLIMAQHVQEAELEQEEKKDVVPENMEIIEVEN